jgi:DNA repair protein RecN (Recombination protein N)
VLVELHIRNLGVISEALLELAPGLNVVTGETGVGKTLLVSSLTLLTGGRAQARAVLPGASEAAVEAVVAAPPALRARLADLGVEPDEDLVLARRLAADGRSRAWVGDRLVGVSTLAELGEELVELHGQGTGFALAKPHAQLAALDALAKSEEVLGRYRHALARLRELERTHAELHTDERTREREIELLTYEVEEIERASLEAEEEGRIAAALARLEHAERLAGAAADVLTRAGPDGAAGLLAEAHKAMEEAAAIDASAAPIVSRLGELAAESAELAWDVRAWAEGLEGDPQHLETLRERRALISALKRKYAPDVEAIIEVGVAGRRRLDELEGTDERLAQLQREIDELRAEVTAAAAELSKRRRRAAKQMTKLVSAELPALALPNATFEVVCEKTAELTESGSDNVEFRFSSSRSRPPDVIGKIASGGELSRAMIAVTLALAQSHAVPVLVFDEADQGVGGEAALELARRLARLGRTHQVLVVSHLPQIAAFADHHVAVRRTGDAVSVDVLDETGRLHEISRMLAGLESSDLARAHAAELLEMARRERHGASAQAV